MHLSRSDGLPVDDERIDSCFFYFFYLLTLIMLGAVGKTFWNASVGYKYDRGVIGRYLEKADTRIQIRRTNTFMGVHIVLYV